MKRILLLLVLVCALSVSCSKTEDLTLDNGLVSMTISGKNGCLKSFVNLSDGTEMVDTALASDRLWMAYPQDGRSAIDAQSSSFSAKRLSRRVALLRWEDAEGRSVEAHVMLGRKEPLSYWSASIAGLEPGSLRSFRFPLIGGIKAMSDEKLAISNWQGTLMDIHREEIPADVPVSYSWTSPSAITMQLLALYGSEGDMVYMASDDTLSRTKRFDLVLSKDATEFSMESSLPKDYSVATYSAGFNTVLGFFKGDWHDAASTYRKWAVRQEWYRNSRVRSGKTPQWARNTALWVWNRGYASNVLSEAEDAKEFIDGLPVSVLWHWWHSCPYDDGFPEYVPPRDGADSFKRAVSRAAEKDIHEIVYMNSIQWGTSAQSFENEGAAPYCARREDGGDYSAMFNVFTRHKLAPMCMATDFWKDKYCSLADSVICGYGVSGVYMDQACTSFDCYNPDHGHPIGPGSYWLDGFHKLTEMIRDTVAREGFSPALAGEGSGESWLTSLDLFLTLEASRERYLGYSNVETIPMFQEVYHDCAITFGSYSSLVYPPYDDMWPVEFRPANAETELPEEFNMQFRMEQAKGFVWGTQPMIANYHSFLKQTRPQEMEFLKKIVKTRHNAPEYLGCGVYTRFPEVPSEQISIPVSRISIYAGRTGNTVTRGEVNVSSIYSGGWISADRGCAVALANITDEAQPVGFVFNPSDYGIKGKYNVNIIDSEGRRSFAMGVNGPFPVEMDMAAREAMLIEFRK